MSGDTPRPVWLSEDDFFDLLAGGQQMLRLRQKLIDAWDTAPADPVEAVVSTLFDQLRARYPGIQIGDPVATAKSIAKDAEQIIRALHPGLAPDTKEDTT